MTDIPLICIRASALNNPPVKSHRDFCSLCGSLVVVADSSPDVETIWCWECAAPLIEKDADPQLVITDRQLADVIAYFELPK